MRRSRLSLFYLAGYLIPTGLGLMFAPQAVLAALMSTGKYEDAFVQFTGVMMVVLGIIVVQVIRHQASQLYPTTLVVRSLIVAWMLYLYGATGDPLFLMIVGVVALGLAITGTCYLLDRRERA